MDTIPTDKKRNSEKLFSCPLLKYLQLDPVAKWGKMFKVIFLVVARNFTTLM